jgi:hypothetical protein
VELGVAVIACVLLGLVSVQPHDYGYYWSHSRAVTLGLTITFLLVNGATALLGATFLAATSQPNLAGWSKVLAMILIGQGVVRADFSRLLLQQDKQTIESLVDNPRTDSSSSSSVTRQGGTMIKVVLSWLVSALDEVSRKDVEHKYGRIANDPANDDILANVAIELYEAYIVKDPLVHEGAEAVVIRYLTEKINELFTATSPQDRTAERARYAIKWWCIKTTIANHHY